MVPLCGFRRFAVPGRRLQLGNQPFQRQPLSNPFRSSSAPQQQQQEVTGSIPAQRPAAHASQIETRPLPQATYQPGYSAAQQSRPMATAQSGVSGGGRGLASYQPASAPAQQDITGSVRAPAQPQPAPLPPATRPAMQQSNSNWTWEGGTAITVAPGETLNSISNRYGVPAAAIAQSNGFAPNAPVYPGQRVVIPRYNYSGSSAPAAQAPQPPAKPVAVVNTTSHRTAPVPSGSGMTHVVGPGENLTIIARRYGKSLTEIAAANNIQPYHKVRMGDRIIIPGQRNAAAMQPAPAPQALPQQPNRMAMSQQPTNSARIVTPANEMPTDDSGANAEPSGGAAGFRWPVRGRIIAGFGPKPTGQQNDGINLAVPEGTPVKAADDGVVAYAGNELKGYGNLVLIRHANGFVTAYAHASELMVKRGDSIKRGQVIAKSGQTGNVSSPQLHFEIRKGSSPVDPMQHLPAG